MSCEWISPEVGTNASQELLDVSLECLPENVSLTLVPGWRKLGRHIRGRAERLYNSEKRFFGHGTGSQPTEMWTGFSRMPVERTKTEYPIQVLPVCPGVQVTELEDLVVLGGPIGSAALESTVEERPRFFKPSSKSSKGSTPTMPCFCLRIAFICLGYFMSFALLHVSNFVKNYTALTITYVHPLNLSSTSAWASPVTNKYSCLWN